MRFKFSVESIHYSKTEISEGDEIYEVPRISARTMSRYRLLKYREGMDPKVEGVFTSINEMVSHLRRWGAGFNFSPRHIEHFNFRMAHEDAPDEDCKVHLTRYIPGRHSPMEMRGLCNLYWINFSRRDGHVQQTDYFFGEE